MLNPNIDVWLNGPFDEEVKREIRRLLKEAPEELNDAFYCNLSFGTGGMRGIMGVGTNRINKYTIGRATQGLASYIKKKFPQPHSVFIGYDVRHRSREFAEECARVLAGNGIQPLLAEEVCPTPLTSFACRHYHCSAAIMITASHNPPEYNGYKVYGPDGGQIVPPHDLGIVEEAKRIESPSQIQRDTSPHPYRSIKGELDAAYLKELKKHQLLPPLPLKILYTNLHGTGIRLVPKALASWGYEELSLVEPQAPLDGNFSNAPSPNPEEEKALHLGTKLLVQEKQDLLIATDPDADRVGIATLHGGQAVRLTGNQTACLLLYHLAQTLSSQKKMPPSPAFVKTIVTTELFAKIARHFQGALFDVLTGFKYIGELIETWDQTKAHHFVFGAEESYGSLFGTFVRDKDAISASCLIAEMAAYAKREGKSLLDRLFDLYAQFGIHREETVSLSFPPTQEGMELMKGVMNRLRSQPPERIGNLKVSSKEDFLEEKSTGLPRSDVLRFWLTDGTKFVIRPSGTEPKIKLYVEIVQEAKQGAMEEQVALADRKLAERIAAFKKLIH